MAFLTWKSPLTSEERAGRRQLMLADALALSTLFIIVVVLAVVTDSLYRSYSSHQTALALRWFDRGELALQDGRPEAAVDAFRSALALAPGQRKMEIALAEALASAGRVQEASAYFNALAESQPGSGIINLQLARLAARQGNAAQALTDYQKSIYGDWQGDGYRRRREVRMELVRYLVSRGLYPQATNELLIATGNAPENDTVTLLEIAEWMEKAQDPGDAHTVYRSILRHSPSQAAVEGAGRTAFQIGHFLEAKQDLERAANGSGSGRQPDQQSHDLLRDVSRLLVLDPSLPLNPSARAARILSDRKIARVRLATCAAEQEKAQETAKPDTPKSQNSPGSASLPKSLEGTLASLASRLRRRAAEAPQAGAAEAANPPQDALENLVARWSQQPTHITLSQLEDNPDLAQSQVQLVFDTERITQQVCGTPAGDDALLLRIAQAPNAVERE